MFDEAMQQFSNQVQNLMILLMLINAVVHVFFAGAVARDAGNMNKTAQKTAMVSGTIWAFATLIGGVFVAAIYWFIHHSTLTRPAVREKNYDRA